MTTSSGLPLIFINGKPAAAVSVLDRAFQYGDGCFETIAVTNGTANLLQKHLNRLKAGLQRLAFPEIDFKKLAVDIEQKATAYPFSVFKLIISRGVSARGYKIPDKPDLCQVLIISEKTKPSIPVRLKFCETCLGSSPLLGGLKHLNRLEQVMARSEWQGEEYFEGLMLNQHEEVVEGTQSNLFLFACGQLVTPVIKDCGVAGVMREHIMETAVANGMEVKETTITKEDCIKADALYLSNSLIGIKRADRLENHQYDRSGLPQNIIDQIMAGAFA